MIAMNESMERLVEAVVGKLFIPLEASGRHVHVTKEQAMTLFGHSLTPVRPLSQPGQYLAKERVTVKGPKGEFHNVAVLGPERNEAQVEISLTDGRTLGLTPPVRPSGNVAGSPGAELIGSAGSVRIAQGVIAAQRHIHMTPADAANFQVADKQVVRLKTFTDRPVILEDVLIRVSPDFATFAHLDYDEANACGFRAGDLGRILP
jgi:propanediol utilization protein